MSTPTIERRRTDEHGTWRSDAPERRVDTPTDFESLTPSEVTRTQRPLPDQLIDRYVRIAVAKARVEVLEDGSGWFAEVPNFKGVWAEGASEEEALKDLATTLRSWVVLKMRQGHADIPPLDDIYLSLG